MLLSVALAVGTFGFVLMFLRFVQPELIYALREQTISVRSNRAFLAVEAGLPVQRGLMPQLLIKDFRFETRLYDGEYVLNRLLKLRELYRLQGQQLVHEAASAQRQATHPQFCILELANLLGNLSRQLKPSATYMRPVVDAGAILRFVGDSVRRTRSEPALGTEREIEQWFIDEPISIEQVAEVLIAGSLGLAYRQRAEAEPVSPSTVQSANRDALVLILAVEKALRLIVRDSLENDQPQSSFESRVSAALKNKYSQVLNRMKRSRSDSPDVSVELIESLTLPELQTLINHEWNALKQHFEGHSRDWLINRLDFLIGVRNPLAHARRTRRADRAQAVAYADEILRTLRRGRS